MLMKAAFPVVAFLSRIALSLFLPVDGIGVKLLLE